MAVAFLCFALCSCAGLHGTTAARADPSSVPREYRALYGELAIKLDELIARIPSRWNGRRAGTAIGVELLVANSNRGEVLLTDRVFSATTLTLDRLQDLGVRSVALSIQFPILTSSYPRSADYCDFYRRVAREIRRRGLVLVVEMGTTFREPEFSKVTVNYSGLTMKSFNAQLRQMARRIVENLRPDYLTILNEPDTQANNTGLNFSVPNYETTIRHVAEGLEHGGAHLGAGAGTWSKMGYFSALVRIPELDYIDMHIYPVQGDFVIDRVIRVANMAQKQRKGVSIGEAWLYKVSGEELGRLSPVKAFARDVYSFWEPLDTRFVEVLVGLSHHVHAEFCSFFWMKYLYAYLDYNSTTKRLTPQQLINTMDLVAGRHIVSNSLSGTGEVFKMLIAPNQ